MLLTTKGVKKKYGNRYVVEDINLELQKGKVYGLLGPNGSGKSTLMKIIAGLVSSDESKPIFKGEELSIEDKNNIAYMPTEPFFYSFMTGDTAGKYYKDFFADFDYEYYKQLVTTMGVDIKQKMSSLSSGQLAKVKIALTISRNVDIYMLDEPLNGIDLVARDEVIKAILNRSNDKNCILISSHLVEEMEAFLDNVYMIGEGRVLLQGGCDEIRNEKGLSITDMYRQIYSSGGESNC